jgi:hypothetical protein
MASLLRQSSSHGKLQLPKRPRPQACAMQQGSLKWLGPWRTTHLFSSKDGQYTMIFSVGDHWRLVCFCDRVAVGGLACMALSSVEASAGRSGACWGMPP